MSRFPVWIDAEMTVAEIAAVFNAAGFHLHSDGAGRTVFDRVPGIVKRDEPKTNVVPMRKKAR